MSEAKKSRKLKLKKLSQKISGSRDGRFKILTKLAQEGTGVGFQSGQITSQLFSQPPRATKLPYERGPISISGSRDGRTYYYNPNEGQNVFYIVNSPIRGEAGKHVENFSDLYFQLLKSGVGQGMEQAKSQYESFLEEDPDLKLKIVEKIERDRKNIEEGRKAAEKAQAEKAKSEGGGASPQATEQPGTQTAVARGEGSRERRARPTPIARGTSTYTGPNDPESIKAIIRKEFTAAGFPIELAEAAIVNAKKESNLNDPRYMVGDGGNSVGLFQLNIKGAGNWIIERDENGKVIYDPRMDPVQNTRGIIAELKSRINQGANGFPSIREALDRRASVAELAGLFCYHIERPANRIGDSNARAIEAMKTSPAPSKNMFGVPYNPASLKSGAQKLFPMKEMAAPPANVAAPVTAGDSSLDRLIKIASIQIDLGNQDIFEDAIISLAKSKNVPTNKKLWERAKAAAKAKFDIYPSAYCVPEDNSQALTTDGWKWVHELKVGDEILSYDILNDSLKYSPIKSIHRFKNEKVVKIESPGLLYSVECTPNHKKVLGYSREWFEDRENFIKDATEKHSIIKNVKSGNITYNKAREVLPSIQHWSEKYGDLDLEEFLLSIKSDMPKLRAIEDLPDGNGFLVVSAKLDKKYSNSSLERYIKYKTDPVKMVLSMSLDQLEAFLYSAIMCDGWQTNDSEYSCSYGFSQKDRSNLEAVRLAGFLTGHMVSEGGTLKGSECTPLHIKSRRIISCSKLEVCEFGDPRDVWCPETEYGTWVMKQGTTVTITGNSNAWASRWYKSKGGGWRKVKKNKAEDQMSVGALSKLTDDSDWLKENMQEMKESEVPEWVEYLLSQVARDMSHVMEYMKHRNESDGKMYIAQLSMVNKAAEELRDTMSVLSEEEVPEWVESLISDMASDLGHVKDYMEHGHHHKTASKLFDPLYYFEIKWKDYIDNGFFLTKKAVYRDSGLGRWFKEKWVDISRKTKSGRYAPCGRSDAKPGAYPKCRPSKRVTKQTPKTTGEMSSKEEKSAISQKRRKQRKRKIETKGQKPIVDSHLKKD